jgi:beta-fructofuranosidase
MPLRLPDKWIWDFWLAHDRGRHHVFFLQAPRALGQPRLRHRHASIGHAVSDDLRAWEVLPDALHPGAPGSWDDLATWTGSTIAHDGRWYMLYTGVNRSEGGLVQRIGLAVSDDLVHWEKHAANPVIEADPRWYELLDLTRWRDQSWRDPWLFRAPSDDRVHALITARSPAAASDGAGVVGHAQSVDLVEWEVGPPLTAPGDFAQVEVPQLIQMDGRFDILVSCFAEDHSHTRVAGLGAPGETGTYVYSADQAFGPFSPPTGPIAAPDGPLGTLYAGKLVQEGSAGWRFIAFRGDGDRDFLGELTDPLPVLRDASGRIGVRYPGLVTDPTPNG